MKPFSCKIWTILILLLSVSCSHKHSGDDSIETTIHLRTLPKFTHSSFLARGNGDCMYFVVEIHKDDLDGELVSRQEIGTQKSADGSSSVELNEQLDPGHYKVVAWAVCSEDVNGSGCLFSLSDLSNIRYNKGYDGCSDKKECYEARFDMNLSEDEQDSKATFTSEMHCPMGSVEIIATDLDEFSRQMASQGTSLDDYYITWNFDLYFPVGYNVLTGLPNKAETQVSFKSKIEALAATEASVGFDYIFVNGDESRVSITLALYDKNNKLLNVYSDIAVNLKRGETTLIRGEYLTKRKGSGVEINPDFDGNIDIVLPD